MKPHYNVIIRYYPLILLSILTYKFADSYKSLFSFFHMIIDILIPVFIGFSIAYLLNPVMKFFENRLKLDRKYSLALSYIAFLACFTAFIMLLIPSILEGTKDFHKGIPKSDEIVKIYSDFTDSLLIKFPFLKDIELKDNIDADSWITKFPDIIKNYFLQLSTLVYSMIAGMINFIIGFAVSIYFLWDKEKFCAAITRSIRAVFGEKIAKIIIDFGKESDKVFGRFIIGKAIDSLIIGILCAIGLTFLNVRFVAVLSIIVGVTNMIPYFGPFMGAIPAIFITLLYDPVLALWVALFIFVLQQLDGYVIGPAILGDSLGISAFWIIFGVLLGAKFFGVIGMLFGVPFVALVRDMFNRKVAGILEKREKDEEILLPPDFLSVKQKEIKEKLNEDD